MNKVSTPHVPAWRPELLAPAGNLETAVAALDAGADALYLGLGKFNARQRAANFTQEELAKLIDFAHTFQRKIYVTFNTLIAESELAPVMTELSGLAELAPDAVIVQDLGVLHLLRRYFPELTVHASTQMGIHNSAGLQEMAALGVKRVILERQITAEELRLMAKGSPVELEVFLHGSLCLSLSGRCYLSKYAEETSGNRGMCRQLCRRNYRLDDMEQGKALLSLHDLNLLDMLGELSQMKIASLKIEGRLRGPDYVVPVVRAYRKAIDALPEASPEAGQELSRTLSRTANSGSWNGFQKMLAPEEPGLFGRRLGSVERADRQGIVIRLFDRMHLGDKIRIITSYGSTAAALELTRMLDAHGEFVTAGNSGTLAAIPGHFENVEPGMRVFKIGENGFDYKKRAASLPEARRTLNLKLVLNATGLKISVPEIPEFCFQSPPLAVAERCAVTDTQLRNIFGSGAPEKWRGVLGKIELQGQWFAPVSVLKQLRRDFWLELAPHLAGLENAPKTTDAALVEFAETYARQTGSGDAAVPDNLFMIPGFIGENDLKLWKKKIREAYDRSVRNFGLGGIHALALLRTLPLGLRDLQLFAVWPFPVANSQAAELLKELHFQGFIPHAELPETELALLKKHCGLPALPQPADCPLLVTRCPIPKTQLIDRRKNTFTTHFDNEEKLYKLYGSSPATEIFHKQEQF